MPPSIFDVIDNFWGKKPKSEIRRAKLRTLNDFAREVNRFYSSFTPPDVPAGEFRTYYGGQTAVSFGCGGHQNDLLNNLLYSHSTIIPDPIARWYFDDFESLAKTPPVVYNNGIAVSDQSEWMSWILTSHRAYGWNLELSRQALEYFVRRMTTLRPLVESGAVLLVSQAHILMEHGDAIVREALLDADHDPVIRACDRKIDEDVPLWDNVRGGIMTPGASGNPPDPKTAQWARAKEAAFHIRKNLAIAASAGGFYVPTTETDGNILKELTIRSGSAYGFSNWQLTAAAGVASLEVPSLERITAQELVSIRNNSDEFNEFRTWLSGKLFSLDASARNAQAKIASQEIETEVARLRRRLSDSAVIKRFIRENALRISAQTAVGIAAGVTIRQTAESATVGALAGIATALFSRDQEKGILTRIARITSASGNTRAPSNGEAISEVPLPLRVPWFGEFHIGPSAQKPRGYAAADLKPLIEDMLKNQGKGEGQFRAVGHR